MHTYDHFSTNSLLAWFLYAAAKDAGPLGQLGAGWVVLNRAAYLYRWPSDPRGVITQGGQFSAFLERLPAAVRDSNFSGPAPLDCCALADLLLAGLTIDPSNGATFFYPAWQPQPLQEVWRHGGYIFYS